MEFEEYNNALSYFEREEYDSETIEYDIADESSNVYVELSESVHSMVANFFKVNKCMKNMYYNQNILYVPCNVNDKQY